MSLLSSRASSRSRLAGAEEGEIMAITLLDTRKFPKPILSNVGSITLPPLFKRLDTFDIHTFRSKYLLEPSFVIIRID